MIWSFFSDTNEINSLKTGHIPPSVNVVALKHLLFQPQRLTAVYPNNCYLQPLPSQGLMPSFKLQRRMPLS